MARFNRMTGKMEGMAGRNAGRKMRRLAKLANRTRVTGKDIKRRLQEEASEGVKVGMSSRALGTLEEGSEHNVVKNMKLVAIDCVADPSYPKAFVNGILESKQWVMVDNDKYEEVYENFERSLQRLPKKEIDVFLRDRILSFIKSI